MRTIRFHVRGPAIGGRRATGGRLGMARREDLHPGNRQSDSKPPATHVVQLAWRARHATNCVAWQFAGRCRNCAGSNTTLIASIRLVGMSCARTPIALPDALHGLRAERARRRAARLVGPTDGSRAECRGAARFPVLVLFGARRPTVVKCEVSHLSVTQSRAVFPERFCSFVVL